MISQVPHTAVALGAIHSEVAPSHVFHAFNASLVALCCLTEKVTSKGGPVLLPQAPVCPCVGFGTLLTVFLSLLGSLLCFIELRKTVDDRTVL